MKEVKKIAATDLDGTVVFEWDRVSDENKKEILKFQEKTNNSLTIVTGRVYFMADFAAKALDVKLPVICSNGASVIDPLTLKYVAKNHFTKSEIKELMECFLDTEIDINISNDFSSHYIKEFDWQEMMKSDPPTLNFSHFPKQQILYKYENLKDMIKNGLDHDESFPTLVANVFNEEERQFVINLCKKRDLLILEFPEDFGWRIEIFKKNVTKSWGLKELIKKYNLTKGDLYVFGDEHNDYPMFRDFPNTYAMGNAIDGIKELAKEVIDTVYNAGVGKKLNEMVDEFI